MDAAVASSGFQQPSKKLHKLAGEKSFIFKTQQLSNFFFWINVHKQEFTEYSTDSTPTQNLETLDNREEARKLRWGLTEREHRQFMSKCEEQFAREMARMA